MRFPAYLKHDVHELEFFLPGNLLSFPPQAAGAVKLSLIDRQAHCRAPLVALDQLQR